MKRKEISSILFVCMGNICRSPLAEGIARVALRDAGLTLALDSAGTHGYHVGAPPDARARRIAREIDCGIEDLRARQVAARDFGGFDLILAADRANLAWLHQHRPARTAASWICCCPGAALRLEPRCPIPTTAGWATSAKWLPCCTRRCPA